MKSHQVIVTYDKRIVRVAFFDSMPEACNWAGDELCNEEETGAIYAEGLEGAYDERQAVASRRGYTVQIVNLAAFVPVIKVTYELDHVGSGTVTFAENDAAMMTKCRGGRMIRRWETTATNRTTRELDTY